jgi:hypothetical protein
MPSSRHLFIATAIAGLLGLAGAAHATPDWQAAAATCVPDSRTTIANEVTGKPGAWVSLSATAAHQDGVKDIYFCNVLSPLDQPVPPTWRNFKLQYSNTVGNEVQAVLYSKDKISGAVATVAAVNSAPSLGVAVATVPLPAAPPLDFVNFAYHIIISVTSIQGSQPRAHMVILTDN